MLRMASKYPASAQAVENCVPLMSPSPSFGPRMTGASPARSSATRAGSRTPSKPASPSPIRVAAICASGARSPEAPTDPCTGTTGVTLRARQSSISFAVSQRIPDAPRPSDRSLRIIISRVVASSSASPTPQQCDRTRFLCSRAVSSGGTRTEASLPKPVFDPVDGHVPGGGLRHQRGRGVDRGARPGHERGGLALAPQRLQRVEGRASGRQKNGHSAPPKIRFHSGLKPIR